ncbi:MAG: hypothetical protein ACK56I_17630, partial [bacterium]
RSLRNDAQRGANHQPRGPKADQRPRSMRQARGTTPGGETPRPRGTVDAHGAQSRFFLMA